MRLSDLGEFGLIKRIRHLSHGENASALVGIGDDAAALKLSAGRVILVTTDLLLENIHFDLSFTDLYSLGWKSAAVNLSDIAAMGGKPRFCLTALGIPKRAAPEHILDFYRGFNRLLRAQKTVLIGGDTCSSPNGLFISVTAIGEVRQGRIITRAGARPGDSIFVTGTLGDSAAGLEFLRIRNDPDRNDHGRLQRGARMSKSAIPPSRAAIERLIKRHVRPNPRLAEGRLIADAGCASAMIDLSDGLSSDLAHICEQSRVGAEIQAGRIPLSAALERTSPNLPKPVLHYALSGGEDYELLFTVPRSRLGRLRSLGLPVSEIGEITPGRTIFLVDSTGGRQTLAPAGYNHFRKDPAGRTKSKRMVL